MRLFFLADVFVELHEQDHEEGMQVLSVLEDAFPHVGFTTLYTLEQSRLDMALQPTRCHLILSSERPTHMDMCPLSDRISYLPQSTHILSQRAIVHYNQREFDQAQQHFEVRHAALTRHSLSSYLFCALRPVLLARTKSPAPERVFISSKPCYLSERFNIF